MSISFEFSDTTLERMSGKGVFLTVGGDKPNTMTIGWGQHIGILEQAGIHSAGAAQPLFLFHS